MVDGIMEKFHASSIEDLHVVIRFLLQHATATNAKEVSTTQFLSLLYVIIRFGYVVQWLRDKIPSLIALCLTILS